MAFFSFHQTTVVQTLVTLSEFQNNAIKSCNVMAFCPLKQLCYLVKSATRPGHTSPFKSDKFMAINAAV